MSPLGSMLRNVKNLVLDPEISKCLKMLTFWYMSSLCLIRTKDQASYLQKSCSILQKSSFKIFSNIEHIRSSISQGIEIKLPKSKKYKSVILGKSSSGIMAPRGRSLFLQLLNANFLRHYTLRMPLGGLYSTVYLTQNI